ncbi:hypothetical protein Leryth_026541 [Lithospermum erythrorhizon]|nr:hypothetical protein Leryth_026541 [Lithospermum erythrorhizon]
MKNSDNHKLPEFEVRDTNHLEWLEFIHKKGYVHCDIKTQNILLGQNGEVLIADFGFAKRSGLKEMSESRCELRGTPMHMSPEMVTGGEVECPADIWALGCVVVEMLTGSPPWSCSDMGSLLMKIGFGDEMPQLPTKLSVEGKDFLGKCFVKHPRNRWTAEMLLNHPFLENINGTDHDTVTLQESCNFPSTSPRCPFDFPEWLSENSSFTTSTTASPTATSAAERLKGLECNRWLDWSGGDDWVNVR